MADSVKHPPFCNTGVENTCKNVNKALMMGYDDKINLQDSAKKNDIVVDWFSVTFKHKRISRILEDFGLIENQDVELFHTGQFGYDQTYVHREKIKFMYRAKDELKWNVYENGDDGESMGVHLVLSGYACREFEQEYSWLWLFRYCVENDANITRIDIAFDSFTDKYFTVSKVRRSIERGCCVSKARKAIKIEEVNITDGKISGETINIGYKGSEVACTFYNKLQERHSANYIVDEKIKYWFRCEIRIRKDSAFALVKKIIENPNQAGIVCLAVLNNYIDFKRESTLTDTNRYRCETIKWWKQFIAINETLQLSNKAIQTSIQKKLQWIDKSVVKSLAQCFLSSFRGDILDLPDVELSLELDDFKREGIKKLEYMDLEAINTYRLEKGGSIYSANDLLELKRLVGLL